MCRDEHTETRGGNTRRMICSLRQNDHTNCPCNKPYDAAGLQPNTCTHARTSGQGRRGACREALTLDNLYKKMPRPLAAGKLGSLVVRHLKVRETLKKKKERNWRYRNSNRKKSGERKWHATNPRDSRLPTLWPPWFQLKQHVPHQDTTPIISCALTVTASQAALTVSITPISLMNFTSFTTQSEGRKFF